jgi:hypothetical protein
VVNSKAEDRMQKVVAMVDNAKQKSKGQPGKKGGGGGGGGDAAADSRPLEVCVSAVAI